MFVQHRGQARDGASGFVADPAWTLKVVLRDCRDLELQSGLCMVGLQGPGDRTAVALDLQNGGVRSCSIF